jgi:hypothetical protein
LFTGEAEGNTTTEAESQVSVKLGEITHILADAYRSERTWLMDFEDDTVQVSQDLYDILSAYWRLRPAA